MTRDDRVGRPLVIQAMASSIPRPDTMAGGYRILIECCRRWADRGCPVRVVTGEPGRAMLRRYLPGESVDCQVVPGLTTLGRLGSTNLVASALFQAVATAATIPRALAVAREQRVFVYSATPFWPDVLPGYLLRRRLPGARWLVGLNMLAPDPRRGFVGEAHPNRRLPDPRGLAFYLNERSVYGLIRRHADLIMVNNELDRERCLADGVAPGRLTIVGMGVDTALAAAVPDAADKDYEGVFVGRLHPQKGALELVDIWRRVVARRPGARLAIIGNGPLEGELRRRVAAAGLADRVRLLGFRDGVEKLRVFRRARVVVHPALYDSGGMAALEAMSCGLPGVSFDLPALRTYYPQGMVKAPCFDWEAFADGVLRLLDDPELYAARQREALEWAGRWDWETVAAGLLEAMRGRLDEARSAECATR